MSTLLVRLKPINKRRGYHIRSYSFQGQRFTVDRGWYEVEESFARSLVDIRQNDRDPHSPPAFDVCTHETAAEIDEAERVEENRRTAGNPDRSALTSEEVSAAGRRAAAARREAEQAKAESAAKDQEIAALKAQIEAAKVPDVSDDAVDETAKETPEAKAAATEEAAATEAQPDPFS